MDSGDPVSYPFNSEVNCYVAGSANGIYQSAGAGNYYLADNALDGAGTTNINPALLTLLAQKTIYPPVQCSGTAFLANTVLLPQAQRDTGVPALGYHYDPIDYLMDNCVVSNATITISNGVAIASYNEPGLKLADGSSIISSGTATAPNWFTRYQSVQEQPLSLGGTNNSKGANIMPAYISTMPSNYYQFTKFTCPADGGIHLYDFGASSSSALKAQDCEFWNGTNLLGGTNGTTVLLDNNLFARSAIYASGPGSLSFSNNLILDLPFEIKTFTVNSGGRNPVVMR